MSRPILITPPAEPVVTLAEIKQHVIVDFDDDDALLTGYVDAAIAYLDGWSGVLGRCMVNQTWKIVLGCWPAVNFARLSFPDVSAVTVTYFDADDVSQTVAAGEVEIGADDLGTFIRFKDDFTRPDINHDRVDPITVQFTAGYGAAAEVPAALKQAVKVLAGHWYRDREAAMSGTIPTGYGHLIAPYRRISI